MERVLVEKVSQGGKWKAELGEVVILQRSRQAEAERIAALVAQVVDDVHTSCIVVVAVCPVPMDHVHWQQTCLPVVGDEHHSAAIARRATQFDGNGHLQSGKREECEAEEVVRILLVVRGVVVEATWPVEGGVINEDVVCALSVAIVLEVVEVSHLVRPSKELKALRALVEGTLVSVVHRRDSHRSVAPDGKVVRILRCHDCQTTALGPGVELRRDDDDGHVQVQRLIVKSAGLALGLRLPLRV
mmetsp:Transcript_70150/g.167579  ORF Transcript_70150/g.167579 Transcript_70150/m.167579 type:complete len:244 (-) Transcript_70150:261-992(-)